MTLVSALDQLVEAIEEKGNILRPYLQTGLSESEITNKLSPLKINIPSEIYELYQWHNGTATHSETSLFDEHFFLPLDIAINKYQELIPIYLPLNEVSRIDFSQLLPFSELDGSFYLIYCGDGPLRGKKNPIINIFEGVSIPFISFASMVETITMWYVKGAYNQRTLDFQLRMQIRNELNPGGLEL